MRIETGEYFQHDRRSGVGQVVEDYPAFPEHRPVLLLTGGGIFSGTLPTPAAKRTAEDEDLPLVIDSMVSNLTNYTELQLRQLKLLQKLIDQNKKERDPLQNR